MFRAVLKDGSTVSGRLLNLDPFNVQLFDSKERLTTLQRADLREFGAIKSSMPSYRDKLTPQELSDAKVKMMEAMAKEPKLPPPLDKPEDVAEAILDAAVHPTRDKKVGAMSRVNTLTAKLAPSLGDKMAAKQADRQQYEESPRDPQGALNRPSERTGVVAQTHGTGGREKINSHPVSE